MQMKLEEDKLNNKSGGDNETPQREGEKIQRISKKPSNNSNYDLQNETPQSSTVRSFDLPPKEYET